MFSKYKTLFFHKLLYIFNVLGCFGHYSSLFKQLWDQLLQAKNRLERRMFYLIEVCNMLDVVTKQISEIFLFRKQTKIRPPTM